MVFRENSNVSEIIVNLELEPLFPEGGYYRETYRSADTLLSGRNLSTTILYLLTPNTLSRLHRLDSDEVYTFLLGDPVKMLLLTPSGRGEILHLGKGLSTKTLFHVVVPRQTWQGFSLVPGGEYALLTTTVSPGFSPKGFDLGKREELKRLFPDYQEEIELLTTDL